MATAVLSPASAPRQERSRQRLLLINSPAGAISDHKISDLPRLLAPGDLLVLNDAATLPASLRARTENGDLLELRLAQRNADGFLAVALGSGDWRRPTEERGAPPPLRRGARLEILQPKRNRAAALTATVIGTDPDHIPPRLLALRFDHSAGDLMQALYAAGRPIQYAYLNRPLELWDVQNVFASRPWAFESPSAAGGLSWEVLGELRRRGVALSSVTHAAGISSTGSPFLDRRLPFAEEYEVPEATILKIDAARSRRGRILAVGTTVVRALESAASSGALRAGRGRAEIVVGSDYPLRVVDAVLSGMHEPRTSHFRLLEAFAPSALLERATTLAAELGYHQHEFGDACLVFRTG
ncbi:MAG TPA: S-adenosylmethionine:tRNA ribosyltransferase-isomerase [Polyangiaceae bacterium]|jgi:S-adenosylmethionine:tRNA ribosyltransferase-isomerase